MKPRYHEIDWKALLKAIIDDGDGKALRLLKRAQCAFPDDRITILTPEFWNRAQYLMTKHGDNHLVERYPLLPDGITSGCFQIESDLDRGPACTTMVYVEPPYLVAMPIETGGCTFNDTSNGKSYTPSAFGFPDADAQSRYAIAVKTILTSFEYIRDMPPQIIGFTDTPGQRRVRKGKSVRVAPYRVATLRPGAEVEVARIQVARASVRGRRAAPEEHAVGGHWKHYGCDGNCDHTWMPLIFEDGKRRARCTGCGGTKTFTKGFRRGDVTKPKRQKVLIVK